MASDPLEKCTAWLDAGRWWTDFPPPPGFKGKQQSHYGCRYYKRHCTPEEAAVMNARKAKEDAAREARRAAWFALDAGEGQPVDE